MQENSSAGPMPDLRNVMRQVASTVAIITTHYDHSDYGMTATSITSVSLQPPAILACINRATRLHAAVLASGCFTANYLAKSQADIARVFGTPDTTDRFRTGTWIPDKYGPRLVGALAEVACELTEVVEAGTHSILIGNVRSTHTHAVPPLLYCDGAYTGLVEAPSSECFGL